MTTRAAPGRVDLTIARFPYSLIKQASMMHHPAGDDTMAIEASAVDVQRRLERMLARQEILDVLARYARGVDRADAELLKSCYHADAIEEHAGNAHEYVDGAVPRIRQMGPMQHLLGSSYIEIEGGVAWVETYVWTFARF